MFSRLTILSQQLGLGSQLRDWYTAATSIPGGHLLIDLTPKRAALFDFAGTVDRFPLFFFLKKTRDYFSEW